MATSGTVAFNLSIEEIIEDAFERCGGQARAGYDLKSARRSLNLLFSEWGNRGLHYWEVDNKSIKLNEDQNVYDAAALSCIMPLSTDSVADRSNSKDIPDFTRGLWKTAKPLGIVS